MTDKKHKTANKRSAVFDYLEMLIITLFVCTMIFTYLFRFVTISGDSMMNTLKPGDKVLISLIYGSPKQGDIVVIGVNESITLADSGRVIRKSVEPHNIIKRVIAVEGQTVDIDFGSGAVFIDGERIYEDYLELGLTHKDPGAFTGQYPVTVPEGCVFVMGDNRSVSKDSRSPEIGFVSEDEIIGKAIFN